MQTGRRLQHLTNAELAEYHNMYSACTAKSTRFEKTKIQSLDTKFAYHTVRLLSQVEQILTEGDLDLQEKGRREHMKAIRRGEVTEEDIRKWAADKERSLESLYASSTLQHSPDEAKIKALLLHCLEHHYGCLENCLTNPDAAETALREIREVLDRHAKITASQEKSSRALGNL